MTCDRWREAISARLDGEDGGVESADLDAHLARCPSCRSYAAGAERARAGQRLAVAPEVRDLSGRVRTAVASADRAVRWPLVRALLVVVAVVIITLSLRALVLGDAHDTGSHAARHLGAFAVAYAVGLLVVAARPARARTMLPVAAVLSASLVITAVVDLVDGRIPLAGETRHLPELASVVLVWLLAVPSGRRRAPAHRPPLRAVDDTATDVA